MNSLARTETTLFSSASALMDETGKYRLELSRIWDSAEKNIRMILFIMLNPSTADALVNDPTVRRCMNFAQSWGYGGLYIGNLFAYRSTDPAELIRLSRAGFDAVHENNDSHLRRMQKDSETTVFAWGNEGRLQMRDTEIIDKFPGAFCLGKNQNGTPKHPLYVPAYTQLQQF